MKPNRLRQLLNEGKPTIGTHLISPWPGMIEIIGHSGVFDYVEYVAEYSPFSLDQLEHWGRTIELFPNMSSMIKIEELCRAWVAPRAIDSGIQNVLFADVRTAEEARECVRLVRPETPEAGGVHGVGMRRNVGYVIENGKQAWVDAMNDVVIVLMIEKKGAIENLEAILDVEGIDMVQFGGGDYSVSIGQPGGGRGEETREAYSYLIDLALKKGVHPRVELGGLEQAQRYLDMGVRHFCVGWDLTTLFRWCRDQGQVMEELGLGTVTGGYELGYTAAQD
jgi:4-hydroxy-2-oxoheptanedioate aldolase